MDLSKIRHIFDFVITLYFCVITKYSAISSIQDSETSITSIYHRPTAHCVKATQSVLMERVFCGRKMIVILDKTFPKLLREIKKRGCIDPRF
ncbi:MAG: hypothetical protein EBW32_09055 [Rhodobacteraceae bacterium]|nr:hypothetical protein [Paracoccaceae bacterium]NCW04391.1 hypothetical protein [Paracoccaceae bacterium]NDD89710.1 hypothetical protein [Paracoccaceae bacterium]